MLRGTCSACFRATFSMARRHLHGSVASAAARQSVPTVYNADQLGALPPPLPLWAGADVDALVYRALDDLQPVSSVTLPGRVFNAPVRPDVVHRVVHWQLAKRRAGTASTKTRGEVAGSGRKIRPQKGSGRSRQGEITSPLFRGGGRAHGPKPRDFGYPLPLGVRRNALRSVLSSKFWNGQLWVVESGALQTAKTKDLLAAVGGLGWKSALVLDDVETEDQKRGVESSLRLGTHNVQPILAMNILGANVYDLLRFEMAVISLPALESLSKRFERYESLI
jgi:large subunit ribosomal protein L4